MNLKNKIAVITGGTGVLGEVLTKHMASEGCDLIILYNKSDEKAKKLLKSIANMDIKVNLVKCDFTQPDQLENIYSKKIDPILNGRKIDFLINSAGVVYYSSEQKDDYRFFDEIFSINLKAPYFLMLNGYQRMNEGGGIFNISSTTSKNPFESAKLYSSSKSALDNVSRSFIDMYKTKNISIYTLVPGVICGDDKTIRLNNITLDLNKNYIKNILKDKFKIEKIVNASEIGTVLTSLCKDNDCNDQQIEIEGSYIL